MKTLKSRRKPVPSKARPKKDSNSYPKGWSRQSVEGALAYYENQSEDEAVAEDEAAYN